MCASRCHCVLLLQVMRAKYDPRGADFLDFVHVLAHNPRPALAEHPLRARVFTLMQQTGASSKFVLRKLASAVLPGRGKAKQQFMADRLLLGHVPSTEQQWTKDDCVDILEAVCAHAPEYARIPSDLRTRQAATTSARPAELRAGGGGGSGGGGSGSAGGRFRVPTSRAPSTASGSHPDEGGSAARE
jgi:hypothetical protein